MDDYTELARKYNTDPATLDPDVRAEIEQADAELAAKRARGDIAPPSTMAKQNFPIGLDDNLNPFPIIPDRTEPANDQ